MPPSKIKKEAREILKGKWKKAICIALIFLTISFIFGIIQAFIIEGTLLYNLLDILFFIINIPLSFGLLITFMKLKRGEDVNPFGLFKEGFSRFGKAFGIWFHTFIRILLPLVCLFLIRILHFVLMAVNTNIQLNFIFSIVYIVLLISTIIYVACRALLYLLAYYISYDNPELSSKECVKTSEKLMKGHRGNYLLLLLSFIGWAILILITCLLGTIIIPILLSFFIKNYLLLIIYFLLPSIILYVGMIFLLPYVEVSTICLYDKIVGNKENEKIEE